ncbi:MAG: PEP/pyruvate-binding domain-containing protein [Desulfobacterales bacterium]|nr:PEP/pyruvate-binding domain-containing protein [Desulfobacterales bacterium]
MGIIHNTVRKLFAKKQAPEPSEIDALRHELRKQYHSFRLLLNANNRALEIMAELEQALKGEQPFGMTFVRSRCTAIAVNVFQMIEKLKHLAPNKYGDLSTIFKEIKEHIDQLLTLQTHVADNRLVVPMSAIDKNMSDLVGSKMANLGEVKNNLNLNIPEGFAITTAAYQRFIEHNDLRPEINRRFQTADLEDMESLFTLSAGIQNLISVSQIPQNLENEIMEAWWQTEEKAGFEITAALRSSAMGEDEAGSSFAGMHLSELNVSADYVLDAYKEILASKYSLPAITYRLKKGFKDEDIVMCVGCMVMIDAVAGGVMYTRNPNNVHDDSIFINSAWGLPKAVVDGRVECDLFVVSRDAPPEIVHEDVRTKDKKFVCYPLEGVCRLDLNEEDGAQPSLTHEQIRQLAELAVTIEDHYAVPQDIEWAIDYHGSINILQSRPLRQRESQRLPIPDVLEGQTHEAVIVRKGITASPGAAYGSVFVIRREADILAFPEGAVLVAQQALPRWASLLVRASAVITEQGGVTGHLATVAREFGIPALFGVPRATQKMATGDPVTIDADSGIVYRGRIESLLSAPAPQANIMEGSPVYELLRQASEFIIPLTLLEPDSPDFKPGNAKTLHDITRFIHEKAVKEMFNFAADEDLSVLSSKQLFYKVPMQWWFLNLDDGFTGEIEGEYVNIESIASLPMLAYWEGFTAVPWEGPPPMDGKGLMSVFFQSTANTSLVLGRRSGFADRNYFMISRDYCSMNSRLGYHFTTMEALVNERTSENYIGFQFKGGAADIHRRSGRVRLVGEVLENCGFTVTVKEDTLKARLEGREKDYMLKRLKILGYLSLHTRQLDMIMSSPGKVKYYRNKIETDLETLFHISDD